MTDKIGGRTSDPHPETKIPLIKFENPKKIILQKELDELNQHKFKTSKTKKRIKEICKEITKQPKPSQGWK